MIGNKITLRNRIIITIITNAIAIATSKLNVVSNQFDKNPPDTHPINIPNINPQLVTNFETIVSPHIDLGQIHPDR